MATSKTTKKTTKKKTTTKKADKEKAVDAKIIEETTLLPENPLMASRVMTVEDENEQKTELIEEVQSLAVLNKEVLEAKRRQVELQVDNKKLDAANKLIDGINIVADKALNEETILKVLTKEDLTPQDFKYMAEAMDKMSNTLKSLMNPSVADEFGNRKRTKIIAQFQTHNGGKASIGVSIDNE